MVSAILLCVMNFSLPVRADEYEDPCIAAGTCTDLGEEDENPDKEIFVEEKGIVIIADGTSESEELVNSIESEDIGADLIAVNGGVITLTAEDEEAASEIYGAETGVSIITDGSGSSVSVVSNSIGSEAVGIGISAGTGTAVDVVNDGELYGDTAADIVNTGGTVALDAGYVDGTVGVSVFTGSGTTAVTTEDITAEGIGVFVDVSGSESEASAPKVTVTVNGDITDVYSYTEDPDNPGYEVPDDPIGEESETKAADDVSSGETNPYDERWWTDGGDEDTPQTEEEEWDPGEGWDDDPSEGTGTEIENSTGVIVNADLKDAEVTVDVSGMISMEYGNEVNADSGSTVKVSVTGDVVTDYGNRIAAWEDSTAQFDFGSDVKAGGKAVDTYTDSGTLAVSVSGNIIAQDSDDADNETIAVYSNSEGSGTTEINVGKGVKVSSTDEAYTAYGIASANIGGTITIDIAEDMAVSGNDAVGIYILNDPEESAFGEEEEGSEYGDMPVTDLKTAEEPPVTVVTVHGNVKAEDPGTKSAGAEIWNQNGKTNLIIEGDLTGTGYGLDISALGTGPDSFADILVTGTISGKNASLLVNDEADNDGTEDDNLNLTVWKIDLSESGNAAQDENGNANETVEANIKYIIKIAEGQEDKIKAVRKDGSDLPLSHGYPYALEGERIYLEGINGYDLKEAFNGKEEQTLLERDEDGRFYHDVSKGGAEWLSPERNRAPFPYDPYYSVGFYRVDDLSWLYGKTLPATGFSASHVTELSARPQALSYNTTRLTLQIPGLDVAEPIVTVPEEDGNYPVEWLGSDIGLLEQSSLPGIGITVLTGHNHLNTTEAGPFLALGSLENGERIMISDMRNSLYNYRVYGNYTIPADGFASLADELHEKALVLITCEEESAEGGYLSRRVILADPL